MPLHRIPLGRPPVLATRHHGFGSSVHHDHAGHVSRNGFWVVNLVSENSGSIEIAGERMPFHPGCAVVAPPDTDHRYWFAGPTRKTYTHFRTIPGPAAVAMPVVQDLGPRFQWFRETILGARRVVEAEPERATAMLWNLLWALSSGPAEGAAPAHHPAIRILLDHLAEHLADPVDPAALARLAGTSPTHLNRLCRSAFGVPLAAYIRRCRLERAEHLLTATTGPIAAIAAEVGYPDLQHFNKLVRTATGTSPRELRRRGRTPAP